MADKTKAPIALVNFTEKGPLTTSLKIAEVFDKRHADIMRLIRGLNCSHDFSQRNFAPAEYLDGQGKPRPMLNVTKDGLVMLAGKMNTPEGDALTERYIAAFNFMADRGADALLNEVNEACREHDKVKADASEAGRALALSKGRKKRAEKALAEIHDRLQLTFEGAGFEIVQRLHEPKKIGKRKPNPAQLSPGCPGSTRSPVSEAGQKGDTSADLLLSTEQEVSV